MGNCCPQKEKIRSVETPVTELNGSLDEENRKVDSVGGKGMYANVENERPKIFIQDEVSFN